MAINDFMYIGKPCAFHETVDPNHRIGKFLRNRMSIIDLIPCYFKIDFSKASDSTSDASGLTPSVVYDESIPEFKDTCIGHGLDPVTALRIYTTDDTTVSDNISNNLKDNYFQQALNSLSEKGQPIRDFMGSLDQNAIDSLIGSGGGTGNGLTDKLLKTAVNIAIKGHRVSLPSIWSDSTYTPNFQAIVKLASPYGDPKAIKEFIIKPLLYLLILGSPKTEDGVSYGKPFFLTIKAYGLNYTPIGIISNITLRRGGNDTSFNIYKQPLTIDVSLDFSYLIKGFAHWKQGKGDVNVFNTSEDFEYCKEEVGDTALPTLSHIVKSLRPKSPEVSTVSKVYMKAANSSPLSKISSSSSSSSSSPIVIPSLSSSTIKDAINTINSSIPSIITDTLDDADNYV